MNKYVETYSEYLEAVEKVYSNRDVHILLDILSNRLFELLKLYAYFYNREFSEFLYIILGNIDEYHGIGRFYSTKENYNEDDILDFYKLMHTKLTKSFENGGGNLREKMYVFYIVSSNVCSSKSSLKKLDNIPDLVWWIMEMVYMYNSIKKSGIPSEKYMIFYNKLFGELQINQTNIEYRMKVLSNEMGTPIFADILDLAYKKVDKRVDSEDGIFVKVKNNMPINSAFCYMYRPTVSLIYSLREKMTPARRIRVPENTAVSKRMFSYRYIRHPPLSIEEREYLDGKNVNYWTVASMTTMANPEHPFTMIAEKYDKDVISGISGTAIIMLDFFKIFTDILENTQNRHLLVALLFYFICFPYPGDHSAHEVFSSAEILSALENDKYHWIDYDPSDKVSVTIEKLLNSVTTSKYDIRLDKKHDRYDSDISKIETYADLQGKHHQA